MNACCLWLTDLSLSRKTVINMVVRQRIEMHQLPDQRRNDNHAHTYRDGKPANGGVDLQHAVRTRIFRANGCSD